MKARENERHREKEEGGRQREGERGWDRRRERERGRQSKERWEGEREIERGKEKERERGRACTLSLWLTPQSPFSVTPRPAPTPGALLQVFNNDLSKNVKLSHYKNSDKRKKKLEKYYLKSTKFRYGRTYWNL